MKNLRAILLVGSFASGSLAAGGCSSSGKAISGSADAGPEAEGSTSSSTSSSSSGTSSGGTTGSSSGSTSSSSSTSSGSSDAGEEASSLNDGVDASAWMLTWSDEFDLPNGSAPDPGKWTYDTGGGGFGNNELEYYTKNLSNVSIQNGNLVITSMANTDQNLTCSYPNKGNTCEYTSGRIKTQGLFSQLYGRFEASIKIPAGPGMWPAFWGLGINGGWPQCGEIDIMENRGIEPSINHGSLHGCTNGNCTGYQNATGTYTLPGGAALSADYHLYAMEWAPGVISFYVDGTKYEQQTQSGLAGMNDQWPFTQPFYLILNVAVGGNFGGNPTSATMFPQEMLVDYVRVYQQTGGD